jgi:hypothetical protein
MWTAQIKRLVGIACLALRLNPVKRLLVLLALAASGPAIAAESYHGYITQTGTLGDGTVFVEFAAAVGPAACSSPQVRIDGSRAVAKQILAIALASYLAQSPVQIATDGCLGNFPSLLGQGSWIYPKPL